MKVHDIIRESAKKWPERVALYDEYGELTFSELASEVKALKEQLIKLGIANGHGLGVMAKNGRNFIIGIFAGLAAGATVMPISTHLKNAELEAMLNETKLHAVISDKNVSVITDETPIELDMNVESFYFNQTGQSKEHAFILHIADSAFVRFTSGTTGKTKGVIISHESVIERVDAANKALGLNSNDTIIWVLPMAYHFIVSIVLYIRYGTAIAICKDFFAKTIIDSTNKYNGTLIYASPISLRLLANDKSKATLNGLKRVISTSTAIPLDVCVSFEKRYNISITQAYGIIEIGLPIINIKDCHTDPNAVGHALPDYSIDILDDNYNIITDCKTGNLAIKGPGMFDGYLSPKKTRAEILEHGYFMTGDLASKTDDGLIMIEGRKKSMINVSGNKVFPEEVESVLNSHPAVKFSRVSRGQHSIIGEIVEAKIVLNSGSSAQKIELINYCRKRLSAFKLPQKIKFVTSIKITDSGKVVRS